jgi:hypothetical protein
VESLRKRRNRRKGGSDSSGQAETVVIKIAISQAAFDAFARTLPPSNVVYEIDADEHGECYVWLPPNAVDL